MAFLDTLKTGMETETGGAMLDLLRQMSAAGQKGVTIGMERKERQEEQVLGMSQTAFKLRYDKEEPFITENGEERSLTQKELLGSMMGVPPKGIGWREREDIRALIPSTAEKEWSAAGGLKGTGMSLFKYIQTVYRPKRAGKAPKLGAVEKRTVVALQGILRTGKHIDEETGEETLIHSFTEARDFAKNYIGDRETSPLAWQKIDPYLQRYKQPGVPRRFKFPTTLELGKLGGAKKKGKIQSFKTVKEAEAAKLPSGTRITVDGRPAVIE